MAIMEMKEETEEEILGIGLTKETGIMEMVKTSIEVDLKADTLMQAFTTEDAPLSPPTLAYGVHHVAYAAEHDNARQPPSTTWCRST